MMGLDGVSILLLGMMVYALVIFFVLMKTDHR
jgi:hypothetical protein